MTNRFDILNMQEFLPLKECSHLLAVKSFSSNFHRLLKEAMIRRSYEGLLFVQKQQRTPLLILTTLPPTPATVIHPHLLVQHKLWLLNELYFVPGKTQPTPPWLLFSPLTLIVSDSMAKNVWFLNAATQCLLVLLPLFPSSIIRVIVHVGIALQQSELNKSDFNHHFILWKYCGKSVFISRPIHTVDCSAGHFCRFFSLNTCLQSTCRIHNVGFIDNLFWDRLSLFLKRESLQPNKLGSQMLVLNTQHAM